jgi:hypothetical protein
MTLRPARLSVAYFLLAGAALPAPSALAGRDAAAEAAVVRALPTAKHSLLEGVRTTATSPAVAISAKFEDEGKGLILSVYAAGRGVDVDAEMNVLHEIAGLAGPDRAAGRCRRLRRGDPA